jgi:hypothetical protein
MRADIFFFIAGDIGRRTEAFFAGAVALVGANAPFCFAHRAFCAIDISFRAAGDTVRLRDSG